MIHPFVSGPRIDFGTLEPGLKKIEYVGTSRFHVTPKNTTAIFDTPPNASLSIDLFTHPTTSPKSLGRRHEEPHDLCRVPSVQGKPVAYLRSYYEHSRPIDDVLQPRTLTLHNEDICTGCTHPPPCPCCRPQPRPLPPAISVPPPLPGPSTANPELRSPPRRPAVSRLKRMRLRRIPLRATAPRSVGPPPHIPLRFRRRRRRRIRPTAAECPRRDRTEPSLVRLPSPQPAPRPSARL